MKIERFYLKAYGAFSDYCLDFTGGPGFHVIHGPNEAGKSTTLRALIGLLFGIEERTTDNFIHQNNRLRVGAALATAHDGRLTVMRRKGRKQTLFVLDETRGEECTDQPLAEDALARWLGGLDENLYRALFGLDLDGLVRGSEALLEGKGEIGQSLFTAAAGLADLRQLSDQLETETARLFLPRATAKPTINIALRELDEQRKRAREATVRSSAWEQADRARRQAEKKHTELRAELARLREEQRRLSRVVAHLPLVAEREAMRQEISALADVPLLPAEAQQQRIETEERLRAAMVNQREAQAALDELRQQQSRRVVREALLSHASDIERLHHAAKDYRGALERLPRVEAELDVARQTLIAQLTAIDPGLTTESASIDWPEYIHALMPLPTGRARVQALIEEHSAWLIQDEQCAERERKLSGALQQFRQALATQPAAMPFERLEMAREQVTGQGDLANQQAQLEREIAELETTLAREATALWSGPLDELMTLRVPLLATVNELGDQYRQLAENERSLKDQDRILQRDVGERERELHGLAAAGEIVTHDQVRQVRQHRDASWQRIRQGYIECNDDPDQRRALPALEQTLPEIFESALREADRLADLLHADAKRATSVENLRQRIADMQQARTDLTRQLMALATERSQLDARWRVIAEPLHQADLTPGAAVEWLQRQALLVERAARLETLRRERREIASALAAARKSLDQALQNCGLPGLTEDETWSAALSRARTAIEQARQTAMERANLIKSIGQHEIELGEVAAKRSGLTEKHAAWQAQWNATVADLRLLPEALPAEARVRLEQWDQLAKSLSHLETLTREAQQEQAARASFEGALAELAQAVTEPVDGREADRVAIALYEALSVARDADRLRKQIEADIEKEQQRLAQAETAATIQRDHLAELAHRAGVESPGELASVEDRSQHKRRLSERVAEIEEQLVRGAARPLADVLAEIEGEDLAVANARLDELETTLREYETEVETTHAVYLDARRAFDAIDGSDAAAQAQQQAEEIVARITRQVGAYARVRLAGAIVSRVVQAYREQHQGPVLRRASEIFARITLGSFANLVLDYQDDRQVLLGQRPEGSRVAVTGMSQGTRDQLFLALRIAAIEEHLRQREAVPIAIDDLLVQFDDARAAVTLTVLAELAQQTQVLFFTHHGHLCELAATALPANAWRRHDLTIGPVVGNGAR
jgi:uncharacterized protein YhaN